MAKLKWDTPENREYEHGISHGVLYYGGFSYPWSGLVSVDDSSTPRFASIYVDGFKVADAEQSPDYTGILKCLTYPKIFDYIVGMENDYAGVSHSVSQYGRRFGLSYMTKVIDGNNNERDIIHVLYNLHAVPDSQLYTTYSNQPTPTEFSFKLTGIPVELEYASPAVHFILDTGALSADRKQILLNTLHGYEGGDAKLPTAKQIYDALIDLKEISVVVANGVLTVESNELRYVNENNGVITLDNRAIFAVGPDLIQLELDA